MTITHHSLPQLSELFLTDGGIETSLIYGEGLDLPDFAAFVLLDDEEGREALNRYFRGYVDIAARDGVGLWADERGDRRPADGRRGDREDARRARAGQAGPARSGPGGDLRLRERPDRPALSGDVRPTSPRIRRSRDRARPPSRNRPRPGWAGTHLAVSLLIPVGTGILHPSLTQRMRSSAPRAAAMPSPASDPLAVTALSAADACRVVVRRSSTRTELDKRHGWWRETRGQRRLPSGLRGGSQRRALELADVRRGRG